MSDRRVECLSIFFFFFFTAAKKAGINGDRWGKGEESRGGMRK